MGISETNIFDMEDDMEVVSSDVQGDDSEPNGVKNVTDLKSSIIEMLKAMGRSGEGISDDGDNVDEDEENEEKENLTADDYHNKAVKYSSDGNHKNAIEICKAGLERYPLNVDLISDIIKYSTELGDHETAENYYAILKSTIPVQRWNWRAFTFSFDYKLEADPIGNEAECRTIIADFKKYIPHEERAYVCESELEEALGNYNRSKEVLDTAVKRFKSAGQCAFRLCNKLLELGMYEEVIPVADYALAATAKPQPTVNEEVIAFLQVLAKDALLHSRFATSEKVTENEINSILKAYDVLSENLIIKIRFSQVITTRKLLLTLLKTRL